MQMAHIGGIFQAITLLPSKLKRHGSIKTRYSGVS